MAASKMTGGEKAALVGGGALVLGLVVLAIFEHKANAAPQPSGPCKCPDGSPCPSGDITQCPQLGNSLGPNNQSGQTYNYTGQPQSNVQAAAQALAAVNPCDCANVMLVRAFQQAAGLTVNGQTDGRYGSNTASVLAQYVPNAPAPCAVQPWQGPEGTYTNPGCPSDTGP